MSEEQQVRGETTIRVRYAETDQMELLRSFGLSYRDLEDGGYLLVLTKVEVRYKRPAYYDDLLTIRTTVAKTTAVRIDHAYEVWRDGTLIAEGNTTLACVDREGRPQPLPDVLRALRKER